MLKEVNLQIKIKIWDGYGSFQEKKFLNSMRILVSEQVGTINAKEVLSSFDFDGISRIQKILIQTEPNRKREIDQVDQQILVNVVNPLNFQIFLAPEDSLIKEIEETQLIDQTESEPKNKKKLRNLSIGKIIQIVNEYKEWKNKTGSYTKAQLAMPNRYSKKTLDDYQTIVNKAKAYGIDLDEIKNQLSGDLRQMIKEIENQPQSSTNLQTSRSDISNFEPNQQCQQIQGFYDQNSFYDNSMADRLPLDYLHLDIDDCNQTMNTFYDSYESYQNEN